MAVIVVAMIMAVRFARMGPVRVMRTMGVVRVRRGPGKTGGGPVTGVTDMIVHDAAL